MIPGLTRHRAMTGGNIVVASAASGGGQRDQAGLPVVVGAPAGIQAGDLLYAVTTCDDTAAAVTLACAGWTQHVSVLFSTSNDNGFLTTFYKIATGGEPAAYSWNGAASLQAANVGIMRLTGVNSVSPFGGTAPTTRSGSASANCTFPALTTTAAGGILACCGQGSSYESAVSSSFTPGTGYTLAVASTSQYAASQPNDSECCFAAKSNASNLAAGTITPSGGTFNVAKKYGAMTVFLNPA